MTMNVPGYDTLAAILQRAYDQAAVGKGAERHANEVPFDKQPMQTITAKHGLGFLFGQADKKLQEAHSMVRRSEIDKAKYELLGAINYIAGTILYLEKDVEVFKAPGTNPEVKVKAPASFKTGDKVRIIDKRHTEDGPGWNPDMESTLGRVGTVINVYEGIGFAKICVETECGCWWHAPADLVLVPEAKVEEEDDCSCLACSLRRALGLESVTVVKETELEAGADTETRTSLPPDMSGLLEILKAASRKAAGD